MGWMKLLLVKCLSPYRRYITVGVFSLLFVVSVQAQTERVIETTEITNLRWLAVGAFPAEGENALFTDYLSDSGGEARAHPKAGVTAGHRNSGVQWQEVQPNEKGEFDFDKIWNNRTRAIAYAFTEIPADKERYVVATIGSGNNIQVRLNGEVIYESRLSRKPEADKDTLVLRLKKGLNPLLVKVEGGQSYWKLQWKTHLPPGKLFVNQRATIVPDFRFGENNGAWGQVEVANASSTTLREVTVELLGNELVTAAHSAKVMLSSGEVQRIPFWVATRKIQLGSKAQSLQLRVTSGAESLSLEFAPRIRQTKEYFVTTYRSAVDDSVQPYSVLLPTSYDPTFVYPLIMLLHGAHVTDWGQNIISYDPKEWAIQVAVHDRGNNRYRDIGQVDLDEVMLDVKRRYRIDENRIYLSGHSMGGYGAWFQATRRPDLWAAVSPQAGYADYSLYHPAMRDFGEGTQRRFQDQLLKDWSPLTFAENLLHVPVYIVHGAKDDNVSVEHSRRMAAWLGKLHYDYVYDENPEGGHWWGPRGKNYGIEVVDKPSIWTFLQKHRERTIAPRRVVYSTDNLHYRKAYWVQIDELDTANQLARIEAEITAPNTIAVHLNNIRQFTLRLGDKLVNKEQPLSISINDQSAFHDHLPLSTQLTLRRADDGRYLQLYDDADLHIADERAADDDRCIAAELEKGGTVARTFPVSAAPLRKSAQLYGPIIDAFNTPFLFVVGTMGRGAKSIELNEAARRAAEALSREWMARAYGISKIKRDTELTPEDISSRNLILFGNADTNRLIAQINNELPIKFASTGIIAGSQAVRGDDPGMVMILPNPLNPKRYVVIVGGTTPASFTTASRLRFTELPDYVVFDRRTLAGKDVKFIDGGFFDKFWRLTGQAQEVQAISKQQ